MQQRLDDGIVSRVPGSVGGAGCSTDGGGGSVYAAWGEEDVRAGWLAKLGSAAQQTAIDDYSVMLDRVREQGYAVSFGHENADRFDQVSNRISEGDPGVDISDLRAVMRDISSTFNPSAIERVGQCELRSVTAPVFGPDGVVFTLTLWGPAGEIDWSAFDRLVSALRRTARSASDRIARAVTRSGSRAGLG